MQKALEDTYGKVNVNIQDGTYKAIEEAEPKLELDETEEQNHVIGKKNQYRQRL